MTPNWQTRLLFQVLRGAARLRLPKVEGELKLRGLSGPVEILRDGLGVPHIYAEILGDLFFAQGFVHAQDRLWQMEFNRRLVAGRLSEVLGKPTLAVDRWMRTLTMRRVAEFEVGLLEHKTLSLLQAYANGVNAFIVRGRLPVEFILLRYRPEAWQIADSLAWIKMMAWSLSVNWELELLRARLIDRLGPERAADLEPPHLRRWPYVIPPGADYSHIGEAALERARQARPFVGPSPYQGLGSNNWVLAGSRTVSGKPLLANDMHLTLTAPAIWYENHLVATELEVNATGVSFPGLPGIISGHNSYVAWGFTNGFPDVQDLYMERLRRTSEDRVQAEYNGEWYDCQLLHEEIHVKGGETAVEEVVITRHGPVINRLAPDFTGEQPLALRWTALEPDRMVDGLFEMLQVKDVAAFHQALRYWSTPVQNVVYADIHGDIGYTFPGKIPLRAKGNGKVPVPGWSDEYEWIGYIPFDALPHVINPPQGYIASANNRTVSDDYPVRIDLEPISGDRAQRIHEMILDSALRGGNEQIDSAFIQQMHFDQFSPSARLVARAVKNIPLGSSPADMEIKPYVHLLGEFDARLLADSPAAALYQIFIRQLARLLLERKLDKQPPVGEQAPSGDGQGVVTLTDRWMGKGPVGGLTDTSLSAELWLPWLTHILATPDSPWFMSGGIGNREETLRQALEAAVREARARLGPDWRNWAWGDLHRLTFHHSLGAVELVGLLFNRGPYALGGDSTTIWATGSVYHQVADGPVIGPPFRMVVDLADLRNSLALLVPGQSGNPVSRHYDDQVQAWYEKGYHALLIRREDVERETQAKLMLTPRG